MRVKFQIKKLTRFLFYKPRLRKGSKLYYPYGGRVCQGLRFNWQLGIWLIELNPELAISAGLEKFYKDEALKDTDDECGATCICHEEEDDNLS